MRKLLALTLLLNPLLAGLAFSAVGDTVIYDNVRYIITADSDTAREVSIDYIFEQPYVSVPASIIHDDTEYKITAHTYNPVFPSSDDYSNPAHITKVDFRNAIYITDIPVTSYFTKAIDIDTLILPPNLQKIDNCMASYDPDRPADYFLYERPVGIKRLFASGRNPRYATLARCAHLLEADISCTLLDSLYYNATGTFYGCLWIEKIRVPNSLTHFWGSTFDCCLNLTDINMPDSLIYIGPYVFNACYALDSIVIPAKTSHIDPLFALETHSLKKIVVDPDNTYSVPYFWGTVGLVYNKNNVPQEEIEAEGYNILKNQKYKGNIYIYDSERDAFMVALKALGYSMNTENEEEINAAYEWLLEVNNTMEPSYVTDEVIDAMANGNKDIAVVYSGDAAYILSQNEDMAYFTPNEGTNLWSDAMVIPKNAENPKLANEFINYILTYDASYSNSSTVGYASSNKEVLEEMSAEGGEYFENEAYLPRQGYEKDEIFKDNEVLRTRLSELWTKVKAE